MVPRFSRFGKNMVELSGGTGCLAQETVSPPYDLNGCALTHACHSLLMEWQWHVGLSRQTVWLVSRNPAAIKTDTIEKELTSSKKMWIISSHFSNPPCPNIQIWNNSHQGFLWRTLSNVIPYVWLSALSKPNDWQFNQDSLFVHKLCIQHPVPSSQVFW